MKGATIKYLMVSDNPEPVSNDLYKMWLAFLKTGEITLHNPSKSINEDLISEDVLKPIYAEEIPMNRSERRKYKKGLREFSDKRIKKSDFIPS